MTPTDARDSIPETLTPEQVKAALKTVAYPGLTRDLVSFGMVQHVAVCDGRVKVQLALRTTDETIPRRLASSIETALFPLGVKSVAIEIVPPSAAPAPTRRGTPDPWSEQVRLASVRHVVAVGAGKGGVGKSTVAVNIALALARDGIRAGLLDADIYGPSLPILLGIEDGAARVRMSPEKHIEPLEAHGLPMISFGFFLGEGSPAIWRGPMVSKAVKQFARGVAWPELDVLVVDLPPGTGDVPLSLAQAVALSGAVIVTQPPRLAAAEARKAAEMFRALEVPVLGVVENMSGVFGRGAGPSVASELGVPFLGEVPFDEAIVDEGDRGAPTMVERADSATGQAFDRIAERVAEALGWRRAQQT
ncbi:MAG TPA: Mrp/NBP35 family ATP-binding protein [Gemmatimonadaceae bacterium]|jgi:ATP-binding protein involved in chromosome partitioning|nr:Mrp/NBP35 family ATP-binding protein [Gemmatimonadaceae bacterium]